MCARCSPGRVAPFAVQRMGSASSPASGNPATGTIAVATGTALLDVPGTVRTAATIASTTGLGAELASGGGITTTAPLIAGRTVGTYLYGTHPYGGIDSRPPHGRLRRADPGQVSDQRHQSAGATRHSSLAATSDCRSTLCCSRKIGQLSPVSISATGPTSPTVVVPSYGTWTFQAACREPATVCHWKVTGLELYAVKRWIGTLAGLRSVPTAALKRYSGA
jgi:hypothetical protein